MISFAHPAPARRDVSADRHDTWSGDAMDALRPPDERGAMRTAKSRGPGAPTLASSLPVTNRQVTEANKPGTPGRSRISRNPLRRGCRLFWLPCVACVRKSALSLHARLAGAACIRHSLRPRAYEGDILLQDSGISCRENAQARNVIQEKLILTSLTASALASRLHAWPCADARTPRGDVLVGRVERLADLVAEIDRAIQQDVGERETLAAEPLPADGHLAVEPFQA